jgi:hypothetical protein
VTQQRFAQSNIRAVTNSITYFGMPSTVSTNWQVNHKNAYRTLTPESKAIIDAVGTTPQKLCLIYVPSVWAWDENQNKVDAGGVAIASYYFDTSADTNYLGNAFISADVSPLVPTHEFVHVFGVSNHVNQAHNLMYLKDEGILGILGPKRLTQPQIDLIRADNNQYLK